MGKSTRPPDDPDFWQIVQNIPRPRINKGPSNSRVNHTPAEAASTKSAKEVLIEEPQFFQKLVSETILIINQDDIQWMTDPWEIRRKYLDTQSYDALDVKYRYICEAMLQETGSVEITYNLQNAKKKDSPIGYIKCILKRIIGPNEWGFDLNKSLRLTSGQSYNYWDYISAWKNTFYYQNPQHKHSWFIRLCPELTKFGFPIWFFEWWGNFGPTAQNLPDPIEKLFSPWQ